MLVGFSPSNAEGSRRAERKSPENREAADELTLCPWTKGTVPPCPPPLSHLVAGCMGVMPGKYFLVFITYQFAKMETLS